MSDKIRVPIKPRPVEVDLPPWHVTQPWWPTVELLMERGHTISVAVFTPLPSDAGARSDEILGEHIDLTHGTGRARIVGFDLRLPPEQGRARYFLGVSPPGTPLPTREDIDALLAAGRRPQGIES